MGKEIQSCYWWKQKKGPIPWLDSFLLVPKGPIVSQTLIQLNTRVRLQTIFTSRWFPTDRIKCVYCHAWEPLDLYYLIVSVVSATDYMRFALRVKFPIIWAFEEVNLSLTSPHKSDIYSNRNSWESIFYVFWVSSLWSHVLKLPRLVILQKISGFWLLPSESSINARWQAWPVLSNLPGGILLPRCLRSASSICQPGKHRRLYLLSAQLCQAWKS